MKAALRSIVLGLAVPACAQVAATAPAVPPSAPAAAPAAAPAGDAESLARVRAALQQLQAESGHFNFSARDDDAPAVPVGRPAQSDGLGALLMRGPVLPADSQTGAPADAHRKPPSAGVQLRINDQIKSLTGVDMGPVDVGVGSKLVFRLKY